MFSSSFWTRHFGHASDGLHLASPWSKKKVVQCFLCGIDISLAELSSQCFYETTSPFLVGSWFRSSSKRYSVASNMIGINQQCAFCHCITRSYCGLGFKLYKIQVFDRWLISVSIVQIRSSVPGRGRVVDYCKADAWNAGLLAFQILTNDTEGRLQCFKTIFNPAS